MSRVFVKHKIKCLNVTTAAIAFPFIAVLLSVTALLKVNNDICASVGLKTKGRTRTRGALKAMFALSITVNVLFAIVYLAFLGPLTLTFKTAGKTRNSLSCILSCTPVVLLNTPFDVTTVTLSDVTETYNDPVLTVKYFLIKTMVGLILSPVCVFIFG